MSPLLALSGQSNHARVCPLLDKSGVRREWGEVPVAVVAIKDGAMTAEDVIGICRGKIANYKLPKAVKFLADINFPRSTTGKVKRHELEALLGKDIPPP